MVSRQQVWIAKPPVLSVVGAPSTNIADVVSPNKVSPLAGGFVVASPIVLPPPMNHLDDIADGCTDNGEMEISKVGVAPVMDSKRKAAMVGSNHGRKLLSQSHGSSSGTKDGENMFSVLQSLQGDEGQVSLENSGGDPITLPTDEEFYAGMTLDLTSMVSPPKKKGRGRSKGVKKPMKDGDSVASLPGRTAAAVKKLQNLMAAKDPSITAAEYAKVAVEEKPITANDYTALDKCRFVTSDVVCKGLCPESVLHNFYECAGWLEDAAYFAAIDNHLDTFSWYNWPEPLKNRHLAALEEIYQSQKDFVNRHFIGNVSIQRQWKKVRDYAQLRGISVMGDMPIYVGYHSADVWAHQKQFLLNRSGFPLLVSGFPLMPSVKLVNCGAGLFYTALLMRISFFFPSFYMCPLYDWKAMEKYGYSWWICRLRRAQNLFDEFRIDHFRGFAGFWAVPSEAKIAMAGRWKVGPGKSLFDAIYRDVGKINIIAEDLGVITEDVVDLRKSIGAPGMAVLQFGFGSDSGNPHLPHNHEYNQVVYSGTHDNDTVKSSSPCVCLSSKMIIFIGGIVRVGPVPGAFENLVIVLENKDMKTVKELPSIQGWWDSLQQEEKSNVSSFGEDISWALIRAALSSVARTAIIPMQDILGLGSSARMNIPATQVEWYPVAHDSSSLETGVGGYLVPRVLKLGD
ncbi:hypothetical protein C3L33_18210, partial [Rhododendron williamsianum]